MLLFANIFNEDRFKRVVAIIIACVTLITAGIAFLQSEASALDNQANRDTKRYSTEALGRRISGGAEANFNYNSVYQTWYELDALANAAANRGDDEAAVRYQRVRDDLVDLSPLLSEEFLDSETSETDLARFEAQTYLIEVTKLNQQFEAASVVKDSWGSKGSAYVLHLTLLAVALFLFGLSITIANSFTRWIFSSVGALITLVVCAMAFNTWLQPVYDLRLQGNAIEAYAQGVGLGHQEKHTEAIEAFSQALQAAPNYSNAFVARAQSHAQLGDFAAAISDYEKALSLGNKQSSVAGELAWLYYLEGRQPEAIAMNRTALAISPNELWIQFDLALSLLANGDLEAAKNEYRKGMEYASSQVLEASQKSEEVGSHLWWSLDDAASSLDSFVFEQEPESQLGIIGQELSAQLKSLAVGLEYMGKAPEGSLTATISPFVFSLPEYDDEGDLVAGEASESFAFGSNEVLISFDYQDMQDGQEVLFKVYIDDVEDPSWRIVGPWELGEAGSVEKVLSLAYSDAFVLAPGDYRVELFVDSHFAQVGYFTIEAE